MKIRGFRCLFLLFRPHLCCELLTCMLSEASWKTSERELATLPLLEAKSSFASTKSSSSSSFPCPSSISARQWLGLRLPVFLAIPERISWTHYPQPKYFEIFKSAGSSVIDFLELEQRNVLDEPALSTLRYLEMRVSYGDFVYL